MNKLLLIKNNFNQITDVQISLFAFFTFLNKHSHKFSDEYKIDALPDGMISILKIGHRT